MTNPTGSLTERTNGSWQAQATLPDGKRKSRTFPSKIAAMDWLAQVTATPSGRVPFLVARQAWLEDVEQTKRPNTLAFYEARTRCCTWACSVGEVTTGMAGAALRSEPSQSTRAGAYRAMRAMFDWFRRQGYVVASPVAALDPPKVTKVEHQTWSPEETRRFSAAVREDWYGPLFVLAAHTGLRMGELLGLRWEDVTFGEGTAAIRVRGALLEVSGEIVGWSEPKTARARRVVTVAGEGLEALRAVQGRDETWCFTSQIGTHPHKTNLTQAFRKLCRKAGVPVMRMHDLRHTHATLLLSFGVSPGAVRDRLGHASFATTMDVYGHAMPALDQAAALAFAQGV